MGDGSIFIEIVIFAMIAAFLVYRLRSVLGRRSGEERQRPNPFAPPPAQGRVDLPDNVITLPDRGRAATWTPNPDEPRSVADGLVQIHGADPSFDEKHFLQGARAAFDTIVGAFARGDTATLRPLLADEVYDQFAAAIRQRAAAGERLETRIIKLKDADIIDARLDGRTAVVTIQFVSEQVNVVRDAAGQVIDGDPDRTDEVEDIW
ncbi:MAG TPA: Tim44/TimA family putative adaptor protein, partial [Azospirillaceae bacterium]|nr:Tim44/TimA family putative adaptor protein [Azospirillaceae bacterium]